MRYPHHFPLIKRIRDGSDGIRFRNNDATWRFAWHNEWLRPDQQMGMWFPKCRNWMCWSWTGGTSEAKVWRVQCQARQATDRTNLHSVALIFVLKTFWMGLKLEDAGYQVAEPRFGMHFSKLQKWCFKSLICLTDAHIITHITFI